ncbi:endonuclease/exonuclease/phosphatase family protein [Kineococcus gynurae]|uniref:Endonuclease/exonuclease/phosphatase family protein n=1 Tax=Kineococcus gynurae TaxID=452979 RepID=A0ABV5LND4_9ACTN
MKLLSLNAASGRDIRSGRIGAAGSAALAAAVAEVVAREDVDVVALQEIDRHLPRSGDRHQAHDIAAALREATGRDFHAHFTAAVLGTPGTSSARPAPPRPAAGPADPEPGGYGIALLSALPVLDVRELLMAASSRSMPALLANEGSPHRLVTIPDEQRAAVVAVLDSAAGPVTVVVTHLSFVVPRSIRQARRLRAELADLPRPLVLAGDLNQPPFLVRRVLPWTPLARGATFPSPAPRIQLDHVLLDAPDLDVTLPPAQILRVGGSDHRGLLVEVPLSPSPSPPPRAGR